MVRMRKILLAVCLFSTAALADSWTGTLVDVMCKNKDLTSHTRDCALMCARTGFGLVLSDGKFLKFDEAGNAKALAALKATRKQANLKAKVTGTEEGGVISVQSIEIQ